MPSRYLCRVTIGNQLHVFFVAARCAGEAVEAILRRFPDVETQGEYRATPVPLGLQRSKPQ